MDTPDMVSLLIVRVGALARTPAGNPEGHPACRDDTRWDWFAKKGGALYHELPAQTMS
jgi:hypothetical protein